MYAKLQRKLMENVFVCFKMVSISPLPLTETKYRKIFKIYILCNFNFLNTRR